MDWMALEDATARRHRHVQCWNAIALAAAPRLPLAKLKFDKHQRHLSPLDSQVLSLADDVRQGQKLGSDRAGHFSDGLTWKRERPVTLLAKTHQDVRWIWTLVHLAPVLNTLTNGVQHLNTCQLRSLFTLSALVNSLSSAHMSHSCKTQ